MRINAAVSEFLHYCAVERQLSRHTLDAYAADLQDFGKWLPATLTLSEISEVTMKDYLADMVSERKLSVATVRRRFACLRSFFRRLAERELVADPLNNWRLKLPRRKRLPRALSRGEASSLLRPLAALNSGAAVGVDAMRSLAARLMVCTGMRVGELCKIQIDDFSPDGSALRIHGKGSRDRIAYISDPALRKALSDYIVTVCRKRTSCLSLFVNRYGMPLRPQSFRAWLRRHAAGVGISRRVTPHMLRHTAATLLIETGVDIRFVQRLLGHSSIATTEIYTHVSDEALRATLERADVLGTLAL